MSIDSVESAVAKQEAAFTVGVPVKRLVEQPVERMFSAPSHFLCSLRGHHDSQKALQIILLYSLWRLEQILEGDLGLLADKVVESCCCSCSLELPVSSVCGKLLNIVAFESSNSSLVEDVNALMLSIA